MHELYAVCESIPLSVVSTLRNSALHNPLVSGLWSDESEVQWVRCANQATVWLEYKSTEKFSHQSTTRSHHLDCWRRVGPEEGRTRTTISWKKTCHLITLLFTPSLPAYSSHCFVFALCFSGDVKWSALKRQHGATVCTLSDTIWNVCRDQRFLPHLGATKPFRDRAQASVSHSKQTCVHRTLLMYTL